MIISYSDIVVLSLIVLFTVVGLIKGIFKKMMGFIVFGVSIVLAYYFASPISTLFLDTEMYLSLVDAIGVTGAGWVLISVTGVIAFIVIFLILKLMVHFINKAIETGKLLKAVNRLLGGAFGFLTGLLFATIYLLVLYGLSTVLTDVYIFFIADLGFNPEHFTVSKFLLNTTLQLFTEGIPALV